MKEPRDYHQLLAQARQRGDREALDRCFTEFMGFLEAELGEYRGVSDQKKYFGRSRGPEFRMVPALKTSGGKYPVGCPRSRGWRRVEI
eukprot:4646454-Pyramimonas_sp.AAC.1